GAIQVRGPLRILAVIASRDTGGGGLLDYEAELAAIIGATDPARRGQSAFVTVLDWGSLVAIRDALLAQRFHVLHLSCHARPGELVLEDAAGRPDRVSARRFAAEALPADRGVPLVVLAGCSTALAAPRTETTAAGRTAGAGGGDGGESAEGSVAAAARTAGALAGVARGRLGPGGAGGGGRGDRGVGDGGCGGGVPGAGPPPGSGAGGGGLGCPAGGGSPAPGAA